MGISRAGAPQGRCLSGNGEKAVVGSGGSLGPNLTLGYGRLFANDV
jgi:hypothetical protein